jgi:radical SAM protein with 4Fe4S-binding SPASM domain
MTGWRTGQAEGIPIFEQEMRNMKARFMVSSGALLPRTDRNESPLVQILTDEQYARLIATRPKSACSPLGAELKRCQPGHVRGAISPDGSVSPCELLTDFKLGNLKHQTLRDIWYSSPFLNFRKTFEADSECASCGLNSSCQRCPATSYLETGHLLHCAPVPRHYAALHQRQSQAAEA